MFMADRLTLDAPKRTSAGYMTVRARAARTGVYDYAGCDVDPKNEHGLRDRAVVHVLRDENTVFDKASAQSFIGKPITDDHPSQAVTSANWRDHARGTIMGALRDGDYLAFDLLLTDADAISKVDAGKRELSNGYDANLEFGKFTADDGTECQARQTRISGNHVALVDKGRAGSACAIADVALCDAAPQAFLDTLNTKEAQVKTMLIDGLTVDVSNADTAHATITTLLAARDNARTALTAKDRELAAKDTEIAELKGKVTDQAAIDALADAKADVVARGKAILGGKMPETKGKTASYIRRAVVMAATNDTALADKSDDYIEARFDGLKANDTQRRDPVRDAILNGGGGNGVSASNIRDAARVASLN